MVSTLSGLNFNLYRERLRRHKDSSASWHPAAVYVPPIPIYMSTAVHTFIHTAWFYATDCSQLWPEATLTQASQQLQRVYAHFPWPGQKRKLRFSVPCAAGWTRVLWQEIGCWLLSAWLPTKSICQQHFQSCSSWRQSTKLYLPSTKYQTH